MGTEALNVIAMQTKRTLRTAHTLDVHSNLSDVFTFLRDQHFTGTVEVHMGQGAINYIQVSSSRHLALDLGANMS